MSAPTPNDPHSRKVGRHALLPYADVEVEVLRQRLAEAEELIAAIRNGEVDALVVNRGGQERVYTLETAETPYRHFVHEMQEGALTATRGGTILFANPRFAELVEMPAEQVVGRRLRDFLRDLSFADAWDASIRMESELRSAGGEMIPVAVSAATMMPADGEERICLVVTDLRHTKHMAALAASEAAQQAANATLQEQGEELSAANEELRERSADLFFAKQRLEALMNALPVGVSFAEDASCERVIGNPAVYAQLEIQPSVNVSASAPDPAGAGRRIRYFAEGRELSAGELPLQRAVAENREIPPIELEVELPSGRRWTAYADAAPIRNRNGQAIGGVAVTVDVTQMKALQGVLAELLDSERAARSEAERLARVKDDFLATLSHELRSPLSAILGWAQLLSRGSLDPGESVEAIRTIEFNAQVQKQLIEDLLDVSRITSGKMKLDLKRLELAPVVRNAVASIRPTAEAKGLMLTEEVEAESTIVLADDSRLHQILWNLLTNAVKFTDRGGHVLVRLRCLNDAAEISVADTGIGMAPEFVPQLFDRFIQADNTSTRRHRGLGLGLSIVKHLVELHGGTARAESAGVGRGSTFIITLPAVACAPTVGFDQMPERATGFDGAVCLAGLRTLVVDDQPEALALTERILREHAAEVSTADSAAAALARLQAEGADVLVSDISMPGEDGYSLIRKVRAMDASRLGRIPAIALTAYARPEDRARVLKAGYDAHISKPINSQELVATISGLAGRIKS